MAVSETDHRSPRPEAHRRPTQAVSDDVLEAIRRFDTCTIANAIERFGIRMRNEGYTHAGLTCCTVRFPRVIGYAATAHVRVADPPMTGGAWLDRTDWWSDIALVPAPRVAVIQDLEPKSGAASIAGQVHAAILRAFHCEALITNGAVRDIDAVAEMEFPFFAHSVTPSHGYLHIVDYGKAVDIFGLRIHSGDLLLADCHGVISIPGEIAAELPRVAAEIRAAEKRIIDLCQSPGFSPEELHKLVRNPE